MTTLNAASVLELTKGLSPDVKAELDAILLADAPVWVPQDGPQRMALESQADIVFYGGAAGGGKTDLSIGAALTTHQRSIIFRREAVQLVGIEERMAEILGSRDGYNGTDGLWRIPMHADGVKRVVELGSVKEPEDWKKYQGRPHDLVAFDEICHFLEKQFRALIGWLRTDDPKQRTRVICAGNPPTDSDGEWVKRFWAPWLEPMHPNPAKPGELRWFITNEKGEDEEVADANAGRIIDGEYAQPRSRTFIPSRVDDNLFYVMTGYKGSLVALPEPLRSQMLRGDFQAGTSDPEWQVIPTAWIKAAQARWKPREEKGPMTALGFDVARGGIDKSCAARRHDAWFDEMLSVPGVVTKDGPTAAAFIVPLMRNGVCVCVDTIGVGASAYDFLVGMNANVLSVVASQASTGLTKGGNLRFRNLRAEMYWRVREALDPMAPVPMALPPDPEVLGDLAAVRYKVITMGREAALQMNSKDEIREILGRSPDKGDSIAMTFLDNVPKPISAGHRYVEAEPTDWRL